MFGDSKNHNNDLMKTPNCLEEIENLSILQAFGMIVGEFKEVFELQLSYVVSSSHKGMCKI